ncbi:hypothetical protein ACN42_g10516 [Penicillium freii]|uniref:Uncharacterized protein n=1 Tax=Penicillium freii TaxID=48697 RepID=A0A117NKV8_PENFR|nr:hypothetical protein ACN42_g10516 [Penicillium freii]
MLKCFFAQSAHFDQKPITPRPAGPMARRLTTNQEIAGSIPASVNFFFVRTRSMILHSMLVSTFVSVYLAIF